MWSHLIRYMTFSWCRARVRRGWGPTASGSKFGHWWNFPCSISHDSDVLTRWFWCQTKYLVEMSIQAIRSELRKVFVGDKSKICRGKFKITLCQPILAEKPRGNANNASYWKGSLISHRSVLPCTSRNEWDGFGNVGKSTQRTRWMIARAQTNAKQIFHRLLAKTLYICYAK